MAKSEVKITTDDREWKKMLERMRETEETRLAVGVLRGADNMHPKAKTSTVGEIAIYNEFGTQLIPARSFARDWADIDKQRFADELASAARVVVLGGANQKRVLGNLGARYARSMARRILAGIPPENALATLLQKDGTTPLVDTRTLLGSIDFIIIK